MVIISDELDTLLYVYSFGLKPKDTLDTLDTLDT